MKNFYNLKTTNLLCKVSILFVFMLVFTAGVQAQITSFPWTEGFENNSPTRASWSQINEVLTMDWTYESMPSTDTFLTTTAYEGTLFADFIADSFNQDRTKLVTPVLNLANQTGASLDFFFRNPEWDPDQNFLRVFYRTSATDPWVQLQVYNTDVPNWTNSGSIALPSPSATYQIAFEGEAFFGYAISLDAVTVTTTLGAKDIAITPISFYPNPANDLLNFSGNEMISTVQVFNLLGQQVLEKELNNVKGQIDISNLKTGIYILNAVTENGSTRERIVKN